MEQKVEYVYHWDRIIGAAAVVLALIGILALGLYRWLPSAPETAERPDKTDIEVVELQPTAPDLDQGMQTPAVSSPVESAVAESLTLTEATAATPRANNDKDTTEPPVETEPANVEQRPAKAMPLVEDKHLALPAEPATLTQTEVHEINETPTTPVANAAKPSGALIDTSPVASAIAEPPETPPAPLKETGLRAFEPALMPPTASGTEVIAAQPKTTPIEPTEAAATTAIGQALRPPTASGTEVIKNRQETPLEPTREQSVKVVDQGPPPSAASAAREIVEQPEIPIATTTQPSVKEIEAGLLPSTAGGTGTFAEPTPVDTNRGPFRLLNITKQAATVKRFVLAQSVVNLEPKGGIDDITFDKRGMTAVYCFSEVAGREHPTLEYIWHRNDEVVARVNVGVKGKRWRSYSSKLLNQRMKGNWRVELRGKDNELLASAEFTL